MQTTPVFPRLHRLPAPGRRCHGFTLIELMTTIVVLAVLLAVAVPGLSSFIRSSRVSASQTELVSSFMLARSEATKRGIRVGVAAAVPASGAEFSGGWTVWEDANGDGVVDAGEAVIRRYPALTGDIGIKTISGAAVAIFSPAGFLVPSTAINFKVCGKTSATKGFTVLLEPIGLTDVQGGVTCP